MGRERYSPQEQDFYRRYLASPAWRAVRARRLRQAGHRCEFVSVRHEPGRTIETRCLRTRYLQVHHLTYERLGRERDSDLLVVCWFHHQIEHLLQKRCRWCAQPCLEYDGLAELWLAATLAQMGIDLDGGMVNWKRLPTKEVLLAQIAPTCPRCRGVQIGKPGDG